MERPTHSVTVRLPSHTEFWHTANLPEEGGTLTYRGRLYLVVSCDLLEDAGYVLSLAEMEKPNGVGEPLPA